MSSEEEEPRQISSHKYDDKTQYTGEWFDGKRNGMGHIELPSGVTYYGRFEDGFFSGLGVIRFTDGSKYEGEWKLGWFHGHGIFTRSDGMTFEGEFRGGKIWGKGLLTFPDGSNGYPRHEGQFQDCRFVQKTKCTSTVHNAWKMAMLARSQGEFND